MKEYCFQFQEFLNIWLILGFMSMSQTAFNTDIEHDSAALMPQNGERKANDGRKRVLIVGAGAAG